jgi:large subunit ribosomal protein L15e
MSGQPRHAGKCRNEPNRPPESQVNKMVFYKRLREAWQNKIGTEAWRQMLTELRTEPVTIRLDHPSRLDRARELGFKAKQGFLIVRQRVTRGSHTRPDISGGRRTKHSGVTKLLDKNYQWIAEERAQKKFVNCEVLNSYYVAEDGRHKWYEIILVDKTSPVIQQDAHIKWICDPKNTGRVFRGLTNGAKKSRAIFRSGKGAEKVRRRRR